MPRKEREIINKPFEKEQLMNFTVDKLTDGVHHKDVVSSLREKFKIAESHALQLVNESKDVIKNQMQIRVPFILSIHIERYEYLFNKFEIIGRTDLQAKCLQQKEELLNLKTMLSERLTEDFSSKEVENLFVLDKLEQEDKNRLLELIGKGLKNA